MRIGPVLAGFLGFLILTTPVLAHHKPGHSGGPPWTRDSDSDADESAGPPPGPGNSGAAHWCKTNYNDRDAEHQFANHGQCVSWYAQHRQAKWAQDDGQDSTSSDGQQLDRFGDFEIMDVKIRADGTFRLRGVGAEGLVTASAGSSTANVVAYGEAVAGSDGSWTIEGRYACLSYDSPVEGRIRAQDADEIDRDATTFRCDEVEHD